MKREERMEQKLLRVVLILSLTVSAVYSQTGRSDTHTQAGGEPAGEQGSTPTTLLRHLAGTNQFPPFKQRLALKGESGTGKEVSRRGNNLVINLKPCEEKGDYMSFNQPYDEEDAGETVCSGQTVKLIAVTQK